MTVIKIILITLVTISTVTSESAVDSRLNDTNNSNQGDIKKILRECPCILHSVCPRVFGESPDDIKYLGLMENCQNSEEVRCCGATATFIISAPIEISTKQEILNSAEIIANETPTTTELFDETTENISTTIKPYSLDFDIDDSNTVTYFTTREVFDVTFESTTNENRANTDRTSTKSDATTELYTTTKIELIPNIEELLITNEAQLNYRKTKQLNNVSYVYPSEMSGIPKTTPKNLPDNHEMKSFDNKVEENIMVVYSHDDLSQIMDTTEIPTTEQQTTTETQTTTEKNIPKIKVTTTANLVELVPENSHQISIKTKIESKRRGYRPQRIRLSNLNENSTASIKTDDSSNTTNRIQDYNKRRRIPIKRTTAAPPINNSKTLETTESADSSTQSSNLHLPTHPPRALFNFDPSSRLNFLKRTLANHQQLVSPMDTENVEETTEAQLNTTFRDLIDNQHKLMIEHVHTALKSRTVLSSFDGKDVPEPYNNGYEYLESMIRNRLAKLDDPLKIENDETIAFRANLQTEVPKERVNITSEQVTKKPFRGTKRYMLPASIILNNTPMTSSTDITTKRFRRVRTTTPNTIDRSRVISVTTKSPTPPRHLFTRMPKETTFIKTTTSTTTSSPITTTIEELIESETTTNPQMEEKTTLFKIELPSVIHNNPELIQIDQKVNLNHTQFVGSINPLLADFRPSPLWTLHAEETPAIHIDFTTAPRQSRDTFPVSPVELLNGFQPIVKTEVPLSIIGPIPSSLMVKNEPLIYELPLKESQRQFQ